MKIAHIPVVLLLLCCTLCFSQGVPREHHAPAILTNQVLYNLEGPKTAVLQTSQPVASVAFELVDTLTSQTVYRGKTKAAEQVKEWSAEEWYSVIDLSTVQQPGCYKIRVLLNSNSIESHPFRIEANGLGRTILPAILNFFKHQRADSPEELEADRQLLLYGSDQRVDLHGGWCDASGDVSKYFSHLAYTNYMVPQQIPMVTWSMINTTERLPALLDRLAIKDSLAEEALYGADYIMRSLSKEGYFYMTVFSYFNPDPNVRRVVGLLADSKTTADYPCAWREGAGMAIAALARISQWHKDRDYTSREYLAAAERAFAHAQKNSLRYADDGKDNIIDDYCALMAATELWIATNKDLYRDEARQRAANLGNRLSRESYFITNDKGRPFWHAADAGLPVISLVRYLDREKDTACRATALTTIKRALDYNLGVTQEVTNPFGYARQTFVYQGNIKNGFFIPHENESGWWWQGEDARLGSLAAAMIVGGRLVYPGKGVYGVKPALARYAEKLVAWILGCNPYNMCMLYGYGHHNVPYMASLYGHGAGKGGISNGITGRNGDGSGIEFKTEDNGNEWRWSEQWIPHTGWFLQAVTAMSSNEEAH